MHYKHLVENDSVRLVHLCKQINPAPLPAKRTNHYRSYNRLLGGSSDADVVIPPQLDLHARRSTLEELVGRSLGFGTLTSRLSPIARVIFRDISHVEKLRLSPTCANSNTTFTMDAIPPSYRLLATLPSRICSRRPLPSRLRAARSLAPQWRFTNHIRSISAVADHAPTIDRSKSKLFKDADEAVADIQSGSTVLSAGFGLCGVADTLLQAMQKRGPQSLNSLTAVSNNAGIEDVGGLALLTKNGQVKKLMCSFIGNNKALEKQFLSGGIEIELCPQGTLAERIRAGGAGIPAFYTPTAVNTLLQDGQIPAKFDKDGNAIGFGQKREVREFNGKKFLMETALTADVAIMRAHKVDEAGNCIFRYENGQCSNRQPWLTIDIDIPPRRTVLSWPKPHASPSWKPKRLSQ